MHSSIPAWRSTTDREAWEGLQSMGRKESDTVGNSAQADRNLQKELEVKLWLYLSLPAENNILKNHFEDYF